MSNDQSKLWHGNVRNCRFLEKLMTGFPWIWVPSLTPPPLSLAVFVVGSMPLCILLFDRINLMTMFERRHSCSHTTFGNICLRLFVCLFTFFFFSCVLSCSLHARSVYALFGLSCWSCPLSAHTTLIYVSIVIFISSSGPITQFVHRPGI